MNTLEHARPSPVAAAVPPREPLAMRVLRSVALIGLALVLTLLFGLWLLSLPPMLSITDQLCYGLASRPAGAESRDDHTFIMVSTLILLALLPVTLLYIARRLKLRSWWWAGGGWLAVLPVLAYLAADEPSRRTIRLEEMAPAFPGAEKSYDVLMRYGKRNPIPAARELEKTKFKLVGLPDGPDKPEAFIKFLQARRADIEADWVALEPQRQWLDELNAFDRIGDLGEASPDADIIRFQTWRTLSQRATAKAGLLALDGQGDEAISTLLPVLETSRKLEPSARSLVRLMVARVVQRMLIECASFTLDRTTVSPALRARLATALRQGVGGAAGVRRFVAVDYAGIAGWLSNSTLGSGVMWDGKGGLRGATFDLLGPLLYNRERTLNLHGDLIAELQELAARRESGKIDLRTKEFWANEGRPTFKNFGGRMLNVMTSTSLGNVVRSYWKIEDLRVALLARLNAA